MDFSKRIGVVDEDGIFGEDGYYVWCGSMVKHSDSYYLAYSRWKREYGFEAWVMNSEICLARSDSPLGKFSYVKTLKTADSRGVWDSTCAHNPTLLSADGRIYLYYMGNIGTSWWDCRNHQRIGVMSAIDPEGEWTHCDKPLIDISPSGHDSLMVSNPSVTRMPDGRFLMVHKAVSCEGEFPKGGAVVCGVAVSEYPDRGFKRYEHPIMVNPTHGWSVEDPFIWYEGDRFYSLVKDFQGYFTKSGRASTALFESRNGIDWEPSEFPLAYENVLPLRSGKREVHRLERPQIFFEDNRPTVLLCACAADSEYKEVFNVRIPLR